MDDESGLIHFNINLKADFRKIGFFIAADFQGSVNQSDLLEAYKF
jgi:hypothetical protein